MRNDQSGSALILATMALLAVGIALVATLRLEGRSLALEHAHRDGAEARNLQTAIELYATRHGTLPPPGPLSWQALGVPPSEVEGFRLEGSCEGWSLQKDGITRRFASPAGCQAAKPGG